MNTNTSSVTQLIVKEDAVVARGQRAWGRIKTTAAEQRELWKQVGEALLVGRKENPSNQAFGKWLVEYGFDDIKADTRADAMWLSQSWAVIGSPEHDLTHPTNIRKWHRDQPKEPLPADLSDIKVEVKPVPVVDRKTAEKVAKLVNRAKTNDEGSDIAQRHLEAVAKKHGVTTDELKEAASVQAPYSYFQFSPDQVKSLTEFKTDLLQAYRDMLDEGLTKDAIVSIYMNVINEIKEL